MLYELPLSCGPPWPCASDVNFHSFTGVSGDGRNPASALLLANNTLYGTTYTGGTNCVTFLPGCGTVFSVATSGSSPNFPLYQFVGSPSDGAFPGAGAAYMDTAGNLYNTTQGGGSACPSPGCGTIYKLAPPYTGPTTLLHSFPSVGTDGKQPRDGLTYDPASNRLFGTTTGGGLNGSGIVFKIKPTGANYIKTNDFPSANIAPGVSTGSLVELQGGKHYGTAFLGPCLYTPTCYGSIWRI